MTLDVHVPSIGRRSSRTRMDTFQGHSVEDEVEQRQEEIGPSQLVDAPSTQPSQPPAHRRHRSPTCYTPGTDALGKGTGKTRRR